MEGCRVLVDGWVWVGNGESEVQADVISCPCTLFCQAMWRWGKFISDLSATLSQSQDDPVQFDSVAYTSHLLPIKRNCAIMKLETLAVVHVWTIYTVFLPPWSLGYHPQPLTTQWSVTVVRVIILETSCRHKVVGKSPWVRSKGSAHHVFTDMNAWLNALSQSLYYNQRQETSQSLQGDQRQEDVHINMARIAAVQQQFTMNYIYNYTGRRTCTSHQTRSHLRLSREQIPQSCIFWRRMSSHQILGSGLWYKNLQLSWRMTPSSFWTANAITRREYV